MAVIAVWTALDPSDAALPSATHIISAATYTSNYTQSTWDVGHTWSLAVEEQFYLLWPAILLWLGERRGIWTAVIFVFLAPWIRLTMLAVAPTAYSSFRFETVGDALAIGCVLATWRHRIREFRFVDRVIESRWFVVLPLFGVALQLAAPHPRLYLGQRALYEALTPSILNVIAVATLEWSLRHTDGVVGRFLNKPLVAQVGVMSYSIYLWQQPFLNPYRVQHGGLLTSFPLNVVLIALLSAFSYYVVEHPMLRLRARLQRRRGALA